jgi:hypothetical protein
MNMNKKLIGILVCILFFGATVCPSIIGYEKVIVKKEINDYNNPIKYALESGVLSNNSWFEQDKLIATDGAEDCFSWCVSIDGDYALIGASYDDNKRGSAYVFKRNGTTWTEEQKLLASDRAEDDNFGWSVSIDGDYAFIGSHCDDNENGNYAGSVYVFTRSGTTWTQQAKLMASDGAAYDYFGQAVSIDGDYAFIGAPFDDDDNKGSVYVFKRNGTTWTEEQKLRASDGPTWEYFGRSISIDGDYAIITAHDEDNVKGSAYVFKRNGTIWTEEQKLLASDRDFFIGWVVSIDGDYALIGSPFEDNDRGAAYVFKCNGTIWTEEQKLLASDGEANDFFGRSVSIDGDYAFIGSPFDDSYTGSVYVFKRNGTTWTEEQKLRASDSAEDDDFGWSVSIDGDYALIGALYGDNDNGAAYVFIKGNQPPDAPNITGMSQGKPGVDYDYTFVSTDPDGDDVWYNIGWGDKEIIYIYGPYPSGEEITLTYNWSEKGNYLITCWARDIYNTTSNTTTLEVTIQRSKATENVLLLSILERFPLLQKLIQQFVFGL